MAFARCGCKEKSGKSSLTDDARGVDGNARLFSEHGEEARRRVIAIIEKILLRRDIETIEQTKDSFFKGLSFYKTRFDKGYSLTDCVSMNVMRERNIVEALTHDEHFKQEGFIVLL